MQKKKRNRRLAKVKSGNPKRSEKFMLLICDHNSWPMKKHLMQIPLDENLQYDMKPHIAINMAITFTPFIVSWKKITAKTGIIGRASVLMAFENSDDTTKIKPTTPTDATCHATPTPTTVIT
ncbi:hypothetical protein IEQ34_022367 [Dendrobium chrysotoxum]|uniref:Uncharacterized protein n=1 Tax=Dendrobium chrysotoxum TaxID=161865 RepID=A0AAV7FYU1_DENCH|nr:hypothetical protein IEQ34_022367 [Dendrobium chrysotoxum]